jgi:[methyl-Co(III) methanol-specific corrinoid protein]:coenzyme M methyltransferase
VTPKERVLGLLAGQKVDRVPCFTGMGTVWGVALAEYQYDFADVHVHAKKMAEVGSYPAEAYAYECAVVPFDLCVEAEILGCEMNTFPGREKPLYPNIRKHVIHSEDDLQQLQIPSRVETMGRLPIIMEAIAEIKDRLGANVPVGSYVLGPYTLAGQIMDLNDLMRLTIRKQDQVAALLDKLAELIIKVANAYQKAGVDYLCIREMGATSDILPPQMFERLIVPRLKNILASINCPKILHICGGSLPILGQMLQCGSDAISVENKNKLSETRARIGPKPLLFGNLDGYGVLAEGTPEDVVAEVVRCLEEGSDSPWPGCEISLETPAENLTAMVFAVKEYGHQYWFRNRA